MSKLATPSVSFWVVGDNTDLSHVRLIDAGGGGEVHEVVCYISFTSTDPPTPRCAILKLETYFDPSMLRQKSCTDHQLKVFARKIIRLYGDVTEQDVKNEMRAVVSLCMCHNPHENLITVFKCGCLFSPCYYIDMELCEFNLEVWIHCQKDAEKAKSLSITTTEQSRMAEVCKIMQDVINGVMYIHLQKQIHRDLKPRNGITSLHLHS